MILCLSGGLDSVIAWHYLGKPKTIFFDTGTYSDIEKDVVLTIAPNTIIDKTLNFHTIDTNENAFITNRNLLFAARASAYDDEVVMAGVIDDVVADKSPEAFKAMSQCLNAINNSSNVSVTSPFWDMTKSGIVAWFLSNFPISAKAIINQTFSCYSPKDGKECLACPACFRKWNALYFNGIKGDFFNDVLLNTYFEKAKDGFYFPARNESIMECIREYKGNSVDKRFPLNLKSELETFCFDIDGVLTIETEGHDYHNRTANRDMINQVDGLHSVGHKIILQSARYHEDLKVTIEWLHSHNVPYDEIHLGKPKADYYIDDKMLDMEELLNG
jgi:7-cyano-7-deazaguanine synthase in queuosine biosynthesis